MSADDTHVIFEPVLDKFQHPSCHILVVCLHRRATSLTDSLSQSVAAFLYFLHIRGRMRRVYIYILYPLVSSRAGCELLQLLIERAPSISRRNFKTQRKIWSIDGNRVRVFDQQLDLRMALRLQSANAIAWWQHTFGESDLSGSFRCSKSACSACWPTSAQNSNHRFPTKILP